MFKTLPVVGLFAICAMVPLCAQGETTTQVETKITSAGPVVDNHMSDEERDRLMKEAMEKARLEMEAKKNKEAKDAAAAEKAAQKKQEATRVAAEAQDKIDQAKTAEAKPAATDARKLADEANFPSAKSAYDLPPLKLSETAKEAELSKPATAPESKPEPKKEEPRKVETVKVEDVKKPEPVKKTEAASKTVDLDKEAPVKVTTAKSEPVKTTVKAVETNDPDSNLSVKTTAQAKSEGVKDSEKVVNFHEKDDGRTRKAESASGDGGSVHGRVVGLMRSTAGGSRILVMEDSGRQVQVNLEDGADVPAPQSVVSIRGREVGGNGALRVVSASSVKIESGQSMDRPDREESRSNVEITRSTRVIPGPGPMVMPPFGGPPMIMPGPPMMPPPPPF